MRALAALLALSSLAGAARADEPDCARPAAERAPDPRCGEALDGRGPEPGASAAVTAGRVALFVPRVVSYGLFWPVVKATDVVENHHLADWYEAVLTSDDGRVGVRPVVRYATGFAPSGGLRLFYRRLPGEGSGLAARVEAARATVLYGELAATGSTSTGLSGRVLANRRDDRLFAGPGSASQAELVAAGRGLARFASDIFLAEARWTRPLPLHFTLALHGDVERRDYRADGVRGGPSIATLFRLSSPACDAGTAPADECVDPELAPGFARGLRIAHAGAGLVWDLRAKTRDGGGVAAAVDATVGQGLAGDPSRHVLSTGELVLALGGVDRLLLLRGKASVVHALGGAPVPFEELVSPSGNFGMRGFADGRFRGGSGVVGTVEYRWYVAHRVDATLFSDLGTVAGRDFAGLARARWFPSFGVGLRLYATPAMHWEGALDSGVQLAYAPDGGFRLILAVAAF
jgi:hypothetical protein